VSLKDIKLSRRSIE